MPGSMPGTAQPGAAWPGGPRKPWYTRWWLWLTGCGCLLLAAVVAVMVGTTVIGMLNKGPEQSVETFVDAWNQRDCNALMGVTAGGAYLALQENCQEAVKDEDSFGTMTADVGDSTLSADGETATVPAMMTLTRDGSTAEGLSVEFTLMKTEDGWKITEMNGLP